MSYGDENDDKALLRNFNFFEKGTSVAIDDIDWATASAVRHIEGGLGSSGILLVKLSDDNVVILKPGHPTNLTTELFATKLAKAAGITCPDARMLSESECRRVNAALQKAPFADESQRAGIRRHHQKGNHEWLVESFMPGVPMYASAKCAEALGFTGDIGSGSTAGLAQHLFHEIGRVCVVDAILNNMDRLPYFHRNAGNICNWIVSDDSVNGGFVTPQAIDLQANGITNIAGRATYVERVRSIAASTRKVLEQIHQAPAGEDTGAIWQACPVVKPCVTRVRQHFADNLGAMVSNKSVTWLLEGVVAECDTVQNLQSSIEELFATTKSQVLDARGNDGRYHEQLAAIDVPFIMQLCASV